jgi:hypothetical protein
LTIKPEFETFSFEENCFLSYRWIFSYILPIFAMSNISLKKRSSDGSPGNEVCTLCQKYGTNNGYYEKRERNPL